ncbi:MAG: hydroxyacid dehydrogenase [Clostridia bacterium]|nr:hydroxyacid dehydrogenase [Clostridia bacterium]
MKILVTIPEGLVRDTFLPPDVQSAFAEMGEVVYNTLGRQYTQTELKAALGGVDVVVTGWGTPGITGDVLDGCDSLKLVAHTGGSVADLVDVTTYEKGITVICGNKMFAESVAEGTIAYMMSMLRHIPDYVYSIRNGGWSRGQIEWTDGLFGRTIGILGVGAIARNVMEMLKPFRCKFLVWDDNYTVDPDYLAGVNARQTTLDEVLTSCSIVSLHASMTPASFGLIGKREFMMMQQNALFINTARGAIVRQNEMIEALQERPDLRAVLDVFEVEPVELDSPLRSMQNVYLMPHMAGPTTDHRAAIGRAILADIRSFAEGGELKHEIGCAAASRMTSHKLVDNIMEKKK